MELHYLPHLEDPDRTQFRVSSEAIISGAGTSGSLLDSLRSWVLDLLIKCGRTLDFVMVERLSSRPLYTNHSGCTWTRVSGNTDVEPADLYVILDQCRNSKTLKVICDVISFIVLEDVQRTLNPVLCHG